MREDVAAARPFATWKAAVEARLKALSAEVLYTLRGLRCNFDRPPSSYREPRDVRLCSDAAHGLEGLQLQGHYAGQGRLVFVRGLLHTRAHGVLERAMVRRGRGVPPRLCDPLPEALKQRPRGRGGRPEEPREAQRLRQTLPQRAPLIAGLVEPERARHAAMGTCPQPASRPDGCSGAVRQLPDEETFPRCGLPRRPHLAARPPAGGWDAQPRTAPHQSHTGGPDTRGRSQPADDTRTGCGFFPAWGEWRGVAVFWRCDRRGGGHLSDCAGWPP